MWKKDIVKDKETGEGENAVKNWKKEAVSWIKTFAFTVAAYLLITNTLIVNATVPTGSMENTIKTGSRIIINRLAYVNSEPKRGDVVSFWYPDNEEENFLKRVIGLPGETVEGEDGKIYIDYNKK